MLTKIGLVHLTYDDNGKPKDAVFSPSPYSIKQHTVDSLESVLYKAKCATPEEAKTHAERVFSRWINETNDLEDFDRERHKLEVKQVSCLKWPNGKPMSIVFSIILRPIVPLDDENFRD